MKEVFIGLCHFICIRCFQFLGNYKKEIVCKKLLICKTFPSIMTCSTADKFNMFGIYPFWWIPDMVLENHIGKVPVLFQVKMRLQKSSVISKMIHGYYYHINHVLYQRHKVLFLDRSLACALINKWK